MSIRNTPTLWCDGIEDDSAPAGVRHAEGTRTEHPNGMTHFDGACPHWTMMREVARGIWEPAIPMRASSLLLRWKIERACHRGGGHWWHPTDAMIGWACCRCGKPTDGMPKDGSPRG